MPADYPSTGLATSEVATYRRAQFRVQMDAGAVQEIALHLQHGGNIEPLVVFEDAAGARVLADGHHRLEGALAAKQPQVSVQIRRGTWAEALEFGWEANRANNRVRVTTSDKQRMIDLELEARPEWSDSRIAQRLGVDHKTVGKRRGAILGNSQDAVREVTRGGVTYTQDTAKIGKRPAVTPAPIDPKIVQAQRAAERAGTAIQSKPAFVPLDDAEREAFAKCEALGTQTEIPARAYVPVAADDDWSGEPATDEVFDASAPPAPEAPRPVAREYAAIDEGRAMREVQGACESATSAIRAALERYPLANYRTEALREGAIGALVRLAGFLTDQLPAAARPPEDNRRGFVALKGGK